MNRDKLAAPKERLDFLALGRTHRSFGGGPWSFVSNIINQNMPRFGSAVERIELTIFCNGILVNDHRDFPPLNETESVKFFRKKKLISITYPSSQFTPDEAFSLHLPELKRCISFSRMFRTSTASSELHIPVCLICPNANARWILTQSCQNSSFSISSSLSLQPKRRATCLADKSLYFFHAAKISAPVSLPWGEYA